MEAFQERSKEVSPILLAVKLLGTVGAIVSGGVAVVTLRLLDSFDVFPAASSARTVALYCVDGFNPLINALVPA